jgi:asparagine synthase (glutamine-hydrolysing)
VAQYYDVEEVLAQKAKGDPDGFRSEFADAVRNCLVSDVPVGSCLSGGLDSSSVVCMMRNIEGSAQIETFSLRFPGKKIDESRYQDEVVATQRTSSHVVTFGGNEVLANLLDLVRTQEEPFLGLSALGQYLIMKLVHESGVKVVLDGQGADEIFGGYDYLTAYFCYDLLKSLKLTTLIDTLAHTYHRPRSKIVKYLGGLCLPNTLKSFVLARNKPFLPKAMRRKLDALRDPRFHRKSFHQALVEAIRFYPLPALLRLEDKNSMRWSVEARVPYLEHHFVEYVLSLPSRAKIDSGVTKATLRAGPSGIVPAAILERRDKIGFATPELEIASSANIKATLANIVESKHFKERSYWNWEAVSKMIADAGVNKKSGLFVGEDIWRIILVELWLRTWIEDSQNLLANPHLT